jgi:hypothetical protein
MPNTTTYDIKPDTPRANYCHSQSIAMKTKILHHQHLMMQSTQTHLVARQHPEVEFHVATGLQNHFGLLQPCHIHLTLPVPCR